MMRLLIGLLFVASSQSASATLLDFRFSFNESDSGQYVTGVVRGLENNAVSAAMSVEVLSNSEGYGLGEYVGTGFVDFANSWFVSDGAVEDVFFVTLGAGFGSFREESLAFSAEDPLNCGVPRCVDVVSGSLVRRGVPFLRADSLVSFTPLDVAVPLPATAGLLLLALSMLPVLKPIGAAKAGSRM